MNGGGSGGGSGKSDDGESSSSGNKKIIELTEIWNNVNYDISYKNSYK